MEIYEFTDDDLNRIFGSHRRYDVGTCLKSIDGHYYKQLINLVHNSVVDNKNGKKLSVITNKEFEDALKVTIFNLEIYKYCTPTDFNKN